jgi:DNA-binding response OmpR family regulator
MTETELAATYKVLLVDDDLAVRDMMSEALERNGFDVVPASSVPEALTYIASEKFDVLLTDLHMPSAGDGFTVVSAMRHSQPNALTLLVSGYPDVQSAMSAILLEADEILAKPFEIGKLMDLIKDRLRTRAPAKAATKERVSVILQRCANEIVLGWLARAKLNAELNLLKLSSEERTGHLFKLIDDLVSRLRKTSAAAIDSDALFSSAAVAHGELRYLQGYTPEMLVQESRILQVTIFGTLRNNLNVLDFSLLLPDVMAIADEVDAQLSQSMRSYMKRSKQAA